MVEMSVMKPFAFLKIVVLKLNERFDSLLWVRLFFTSEHRAGIGTLELRILRW